MTARFINLLPAHIHCVPKKWTTKLMAVTLSNLKDEGKGEAVGEGSMKGWVGEKCHVHL